jgi:hypothetical protein
MARGGTRQGSGRPKGSTSRPQIADYVTEQEVKELVKTCKLEAKKGRPELLKFLLEQIFGKAAQSVDVTSQGQQLQSIVYLPAKQKLNGGVETK